MFVLLLGGCLIDAATYERRLEELTDHDGDGVVLEDDCDDDDAAVHPGAGELCNRVDDNCDGEADEGFAGRSETCDGVDEDCDGVVDEDPTDGTLWYGDADRDGYGLAEVVVVACEPPRRNQQRRHRLRRRQRRPVPRLRRGPLRRHRPGLHRLRPHRR